MGGQDIARAPLFLWCVRITRLCLLNQLPCIKSVCCCSGCSADRAGGTKVMGDAQPVSPCPTCKGPSQPLATACMAHLHEARKSGACLHAHSLCTLRGKPVAAAYGCRAWLWMLTCWPGFRRSAWT
jgi:hypothetical protein